MRRPQIVSLRVSVPPCEASFVRSSLALRASINVPRQTRGRNAGAGRVGLLVGEVSNTADHDRRTGSGSAPWCDGDVRPTSPASPPCPRSSTPRRPPSSSTGASRSRRRRPGTWRGGRQVHRGLRARGFCRAPAAGHASHAAAEMRSAIQALNVAQPPGAARRAHRHRYRAGDRRRDRGRSHRTLTVSGDTVVLADRLSRGWSAGRSTASVLRAQAAAFTFRALAPQVLPLRSAPVPAFSLEGIAAGGADSPCRASGCSDARHSRRPGAHARRGGRSERRQATVIFADVRGLEACTTARPPESLRISSTAASRCAEQGRARLRRRGRQIHRRAASWRSSAYRTRSSTPRARRSTPPSRCARLLERLRGEPAGPLHRAHRHQHGPRDRRRARRTGNGVTSRSWATPSTSPRA